MRKVAIVVDRLDSGLGIAARSRAEKNSEIEVIPALSFCSLKSFLVELELGNYETVLFSWRYLLLEIQRDRSSQARLGRIRAKSRLGILIPDYQGIDVFTNVLTSKEREILGNVDYYHVTNNDLASRYKDAWPANNFAGVLHDLPLKKVIDEVLKISSVRKQNKVIWVGNSKWGSRTGFIDYKGFKEIVSPLIDLLAQDGIELDVIDTSRKKRKYIEVLKEVSTSKIIIVTSLQEGTGLPILEGLSLGTFVISTNVGIASEIITRNQVGLIVARDKAVFHRAILENMNLSETEESMKVFKEFYGNSIREEIDPVDHRIQSFNFNVVNEHQILLRLKWSLRFIKNLKYFR